MGKSLFLELITLLTQGQISKFELHLWNHSIDTAAELKFYMRNWEVMYCVKWNNNQPEIFDDDIIKDTSLLLNKLKETQDYNKEEKKDFLHGDKLTNHITKLKTKMKNSNTNICNIRKNEAKHDKSIKIKLLLEKFNKLYINLDPNRLKKEVEEKKKKIEEEIGSNLYNPENNENLTEILIKTKKDNEEKETNDDNEEKKEDYEEEKKKQIWNREYDGISTKQQVSRFIHYLCEFDLIFAFNNKKDGFENIFGTSVVESLNFYLKCASLLRQHDPITGKKLVNMKLHYDNFFFSRKYILSSLLCTYKHFFSYTV